MDFSALVANKAVIFAALFAVSECLGLIPAIKQNTLYEIVLDLLAKLAGKKVE